MFDPFKDFATAGSQLRGLGGTERQARALARLLRSARDVQDRTITAPSPHNHE